LLSALIVVCVSLAGSGARSKRRQSFHHLFSTIIFFILDLTSFVFVRFFTQLQLFLEKLQTSTVDEVAEPMKPEAIKFLLVLDHFRIFLH
jgi:hypothetical protein